MQHFLGCLFRVPACLPVVPGHHGRHAVLHGVVVVVVTVVAVVIAVVVAVVTVVDDGSRGGQENDETDSQASHAHHWLKKNQQKNKTNIAKKMWTLNEVCVWK